MIWIAATLFIVNAVLAGASSRRGETAEVLFHAWIASILFYITIAESTA